MNDGPKNKSAQASWPRTVTWLLFVVGLGSLVVLLWRMGLGEITTQLTAVGWKLPLVVLPYIVVAIFDADGAPGDGRSRRRRLARDNNARGRGGKRLGAGCVVSNACCSERKKRHQNSGAGSGQPGGKR